jgi:hypothetical protein
MKRFFYTVTALLLLNTAVRAQVKVGAPGAADPSATLEVTSGPDGNKGLLLPRLSTAQRNAISLPATGLAIYNTTDNQLQVNMGTPEVPIWTLPASDDAWKTGGNAGTSANNFLGTTDAQPLVLRTSNAERLRIDADGNVGLGVATPTAPLQLSNSLASRKLVLWNGANNNPNRFFGFGVESLTLRYQVNNSGDDHVFFSGVTDDTSLELMRVKGTGNVGIGTATPGGRLSVAGAFGANAGVTVQNTTAENATAMALTPGFDMVTPAANVTTFDIPGVIGAFTFGDNVIGAPGMQLGTGERRWAGVNSQFLNVSELAKIGGSAPTNTMTSITGRDADGLIGNVALGTGLTLVNGTLSATATGSGANIYNSDGTLTGFRTVTQGEHHLIFNGTGGINFNSGRMFMTPQAVGPKLTFIDGGTTHFGLGVSVGQLNYHVASQGESHVFFAGGLNGDGAELMRVGGNGNVAIGTSALSSRLTVAGAFQPNAGMILQNTNPGNTTAMAVTPGFDMSAAAGNITTFDMPGVTGAFTFGDNLIGAPGMQLGLGDRRWASVNSEYMDVNNLGRIGGSVASNTITSITGRDAAGTIGNVTLGAGLSLANGVLSSTATGNGPAGWGLTGNAGTNPAVNFLGTTDAQPLWFRTSNANQMVLTQNGFLGMNTANPTARLTISNTADNEASDDVLIQRFSNGGGVPLLTFSSSGGTEQAPTPFQGRQAVANIAFRARIAGGEAVVGGIRQLYKGTGTQNLGEMQFYTSGQMAVGISETQNVAIGKTTLATQRLDVNGNVIANSYLTASDRRLKTNIVNMKQGVEELMKLRPVTYRMKDDTAKATRFGFIAQEIEKVMPEVVNKPKTDKQFYSVNYAELVPVLTKALQEQQSEIEKLKAELSGVKSQNASLKSELTQTAELKSRISKIEQMLEANGNAGNATTSK